MRSAGWSRTQVPSQGASRRGDPIGPLDWRKILPFRTDASSDRLGWVNLQAARCRAEPAFERSVPALTYHRLVFVARPPRRIGPTLRRSEAALANPPVIGGGQGHVGVCRVGVVRLLLTHSRWQAMCHSPNSAIYRVMVVWCSGAVRRDAQRCRMNASGNIACISILSSGYRD